MAYQGFNFPILTPPFLNPQIGGVPSNLMANVPQGDPYAELQALLNQIGGQAPIQPPQQGTLQTILNSLAQGASILASPDPGGALAQTLQGRQQRQDYYTQLNQKREENLQLIKIQAALERAKGLSDEQATVRQEQRKEIYADRASKRELEQYQGQKRIDIISSVQLARENEKLAQEFEPIRLVRERNRAILQDMPKQRQDSIEWQAMAATVMPNLDPVAAKVIGEKYAGLDRTPMTPEEIDLLKKVNQETSKMTKQEREIKLGKLKAETSRELAEAAYTRAGKPGSANFQDRYANAYNSALGRDVVEGLDNQYFKTPDNRILTIEELNKLPITDQGKFASTPLNPQENAQEVMKRVEKLKQLRIQQQQNQVQQITPQIPASKMTDEAVQQAVRVLSGRGDTSEQIKEALRINGASQEQINKFVSQGKTTTLQAKPTATPSVSRTPYGNIPAPTTEQQKSLEEFMKRRKQ